MKIVNSINELGSFTLIDNTLYVNSSVGNMVYTLEQGFLDELKSELEDFFMASLCEPVLSTRSMSFTDHFWFDDVIVGNYSFSMAAFEPIYYKRVGHESSREMANSDHLPIMLSRFQETFNVVVCEMLSTSEDGYTVVQDNKFT